METILASFVAGMLALVGVIITNYSNNKRMMSEIHTAMAVSDTKIEELTREVRYHNEFARRVPVLEEKVKALEEKINSLEARLAEAGKKV